MNRRNARSLFSFSANPVSQSPRPEQRVIPVKTGIQSDNGVVAHDFDAEGATHGDE